MEFWQLGNTSVRSAMRIKDGRTAYSTSSIQGNIRKGEGDIAFRRLLGQCGVVSLGEDSTNSVGRKWRAAMGKLGFIYPEVKRSTGFTQADLGQLDMITPAGWNLVRAETVAAMQECYLRAMVTPLSVADDRYTFSPLCWTLAILLELENRGIDASVNFLEMAIIVQTTTPVNGLAETVDRILTLRSRRNASNRKRAFDRSRENPCLFAIIECWKDQAAIDFHNNTEHFTGILPKLAALCEGEVSIELFNEITF